MSEDRELSGQEARDLMGRAPTAAAFEPQDPPCRIVTDDDVFIVDDIQAWGYMELGIFANGHWATDVGGGNVVKERDVLIPYDRIKNVEFDFEALKQFEAENGPLS